MGIDQAGFDAFYRQEHRRRRAVRALSGVASVAVLTGVLAVIVTSGGGNGTQAIEITSAQAAELVANARQATIDAGSARFTRNTEHQTIGADPTVTSLGLPAISTEGAFDFAHDRGWSKTTMSSPSVPEPPAVITEVRLLDGVLYQSQPVGPMEPDGVAVQNIHSRVARISGSVQVGGQAVSAGSAEGVPTTLPPEATVAPPPRPPTSLGPAPGRAPAPQLPTKPWVRYDLEAIRAGGAEGATHMADRLVKQLPAGALEILDEVGTTAQAVGPESVGGVDTTHIRGTVEHDRLGGSPVPEEFASMFRESLTVDVWLDSDGRVRRLGITTEKPIPKVLSEKLIEQGTNIGTGSRSIETLELFDFGTEVSVEAPPEADTEDGLKLLEAPTAPPPVPLEMPPYPPAVLLPAPTTTVPE